MADTPRPEVSILIVSYNTRELTLAAIDAVVRETSIPHEIIVVDNASSDGSAAAIAAHPARPRLIKRDDNIGFGRANNIAVRHANADLILLLNPDTVVLYHAIDALVACARMNPQALIWGGRTVFANGELNPSSCWERITLWNLFCRSSGLAAIFPRSPTFHSEAFGGWIRDTDRAVDIVSGCFLLTGRETWQRLGGFDATFYMYGEEADFCLRARKLGAAPMVTPAATIVHLGGASERTRACKMIKLLAAKMTLIDRHLPAWQKPLARVLLKLWPLSRLIALRFSDAIRNRGQTSENTLAWSEIWHQRPAWQDGYPDSASRTKADLTHAAQRN